MTPADYMPLALEHARACRLELALGEELVAEAKESVRRSERAAAAQKIKLALHEAGE